MHPLTHTQTYTRIHTHTHVHTLSESISPNHQYGPCADTLTAGALISSSCARRGLSVLLRLRLSPAAIAAAAAPAPTSCHRLLSATYSSSRRSRVTAPSSSREVVSGLAELQRMLECLMV